MNKALKDKKNKKNLKIFSLLFSFLIWIYVVSSAEVEAEKNIIINYKLPKNYSIDNTVPYKVNVSLKGPRVLVKKYIEDASVLTFDIDKAFTRKKLSYNFPINRKTIRLPLGLELNDISLKSSFVKLGRTLYKEVPIRAKLSNQGVLNPNFIAIDPPLISIKGTKNSLRLIESVVTKEINANLLKENVELVTEIEFSSKKVKLSQGNAVVSYKPKVHDSKFTFSSIPIIFQSTKLIESSTVKTVDVTVSSGVLTQDQIKNKAIKVFANTNGVKKVLKLKVELPDGLELVKVKPDTVTIKFGK